MGGGAEYWTIVLGSIHANAFPVPELTLDFNRPHDHTVKLHSLPSSVPYQIALRTPQRR